MKQEEYIYESMMGEHIDPYPGIKDAFAPGEKCALLYDEIFQANQRLCSRLGTSEDSDIETMINHFFAINRELCLRMYRYGLIQSKK